jgi:hypothetical protein
MDPTLQRLFPLPRHRRADYYGDSALSGEAVDIGRGAARLDARAVGRAGELSALSPQFRVHWMGSTAMVPDQHRESTLTPLLTFVTCPRNSGIQSPEFRSLHRVVSIPMTTDSAQHRRAGPFSWHESCAFAPRMCAPAQRKGGEGELRVCQTNRLPLGCDLFEHDGHAILLESSKVGRCAKAGRAL